MSMGDYDSKTELPVCKDYLERGAARLSAVIY